MEFLFIGKCGVGTREKYRTGFGYSNGNLVPQKTRHVVYGSCLSHYFYLHTLLGEPIMNSERNATFLLLHLSVDVRSKIESS